MTDPDLTIVIPAFNEADNLPPLFTRLRSVLGGMGSRYEIVVVDDASGDETFAVARGLCEAGDARVIRLSRNFGHQAALLAGLRAARGRAVITMDADLQNPPEEIPRLVAAWQAGHHVVHTVRRDTPVSAGWFKRVTARWFYRLFRRQSGLPMRPGMADFRLIDRRALEPVTRGSEARLFLRGMFLWVGFAQTTIDYVHQPRHRGQSSYSLAKMLRLGVAGVLAFSEAPLYWSFWLGCGIATLSMTYGVFAVATHLLTEDAVPGWTSIAALIAFVQGTQFILIGLLGAYVAAIYAEVQGRPPYIVADEFPARERPSGEP